MGLRERQRSLATGLILRAAEELFAEQGYHSTSMDEIARRADCGAATLYGYFKGKSQLFATLVGTRTAEYLTGVEKALEVEGVFATRASSFRRFFTRFHSENLHFLLLLMQLMRAPEQGSMPDPAVADAFKKRYAEVVQDLMEAGVREGALRSANPRVMTSTFLGALHSTMHMWLLDPRDDTPEALVGDVFDLFLNGAGVPAGVS